MTATSPILIRNAEINGSAGHDLLVAGGRIAAIGEQLGAPQDSRVVDAAGGALLPGLTDHHIHLAASAAARSSIACGPEVAGNGADLRHILQDAAAARGSTEWMRGVGYHDCVAGDIDRDWLDAVVPDVPVRIQHRGGRLWIFNSRGLACLQSQSGDPLERRNGRLTGRLYEGDVWLRQRLGTAEPDAFPDLGCISRELASYGVTAVTDATPHNDIAALARFQSARERGQLLQHVTVMGNAELDRAAMPGGLQRGARKFHLLESKLPDFDVMCADITASHAAGRNVAFHCVTRTELVFALAALRTTGCDARDRIEHASVTPPEQLEEIARLGLTVVAQPALVYQRGDQYLNQVATEDQPWLYRLRGFVDAGVPLAGSSDAPFGSLDPWLAMQAAVNRTTRSGQLLGEDESLTPEQALALYLSPAQAPGRPGTQLHSGELADLCLLSSPWAQVRPNLAAAGVQLTLAAGEVVWDRRVAG